MPSYIHLLHPRWQRTIYKTLQGNYLASFECWWGMYADNGYGELQLIAQQA
jgi:hypothetical protein